MKNLIDSIGRNPWRALFVVLALSSVFLFFVLGARNLSSPDEGRYIEIPREMVATGDYVLPRLEGILYFEKPPLFYWLQAGTIKLLGISEFTMRIWPVLFGLAGIAMTFAAARRFYGRPAGIASALVLATALLYYGLSRFVTIDIAVSALIAATLFAFLFGAEEPDRRRQIWYFRATYVAAALACLAKGLIGLALPGAVGLVWIALTGRWRLVPALLIPSGLALFVAIAVPWHVMAALRNHDFLWFYFVHEHFLRYTTEIHNRDQPFWFYFAVVLLGFLPWTGYMLHGLVRSLPRRWRARGERPVELFLLVWIAFIFLFFSLSNSKLITYILPIFPALAILTGHALAPALTGESQSRLTAGPVLFAGVFGALAIAVPAVYLVPALRNLPAVKLYGPMVAPLAIATAIVFAAGALAALWLHRKRRPGGAIAAALLTVLVGWSTIGLIAAKADPYSVKPLARMIATHLRPGDTVVNYYGLYYDLPVYLRRKVAFVGIMGEFEFGASQEDVSGILLKRETFWKRWNSKERMFAVMDRRRFQRLRGELPGPVYVLGRTARAVAITNHPVPDAATSGPQ